YKSTFVFGFDMTEQEKEDVLAFLRSLTDESFIENPRFSNPFE
ncbi:MAG: di-heme enzyme, partial [Myxococcota bacterium]